MNHLRTGRSVFRAVVLVLLLTAGMRAEEPRVTKPFYNKFSDEDELLVGQAFSRRITRDGVLMSAANGKTRVVREMRNPVVETYLEALAAHLSENSQRPAITYHVRLLDDPKTVNALSGPAGYIYIFSGTLDFCTKESE